ncbi:hypothetical protein R6Q59_029672 [Mikania micrantha]
MDEIRKSNVVINSEEKSQNPEGGDHDNERNSDDDFVSENLVDTSTPANSKVKHGEWPRYKSVSTRQKWIKMSSTPDGIPGMLAHYVVDKFDDKKMVIRVNGEKIRVDKESVKNLLGLSSQGRRFEQITPLDVMDKKVKEWRGQYEGRFVGASSLVDSIQRSEDKNNFNFRMNFVMLFVIVLVECTKNGRMKEDILLYVNSIDCKGLKVDPTKQPITFWTKAMLRRREKLEIRDGGFGKGKRRE